MTRLLLIIPVLLGLATTAQAQERSPLLPQVPTATGEPHPEGPEFWRKNHMELLKHDRDLTMRQGDREVDASLAKCFDCHAAKDDDGKIVSYESEKHFCRVCHDFAAVKVDCFMCHRSTPPDTDESGGHAALSAPGWMTRQQTDLAALQSYLTGVITPTEQEAAE
ncbi:MAG: hypothetical protein OEZ19_04185 [Paracoccaceae bacterium]|nr:hypothetical protein [Paracoccaceae bacterium]